MVLHHSERGEFMKAKNVDCKFPSSFNAPKHNMAVFKRTKLLEQFYFELAEEYAADIELGTTFAQAAQVHIERKGVNKAAFETLTLLDGKTYDRIQKNNLPNPSLNTAMAVCIGLKISGVAAEDLLLKAGYRLGISLLHQTYRKFLNSHKGYSIFEYNEILGGLGLPLIQAKEYREAIEGLPQPAM